MSVCANQPRAHAQAKVLRVERVPLPTNSNVSGKAKLLGKKDKTPQRPVSAPTA